MLRFSYASLRRAWRLPDLPCAADAQPAALQEIAAAMRAYEQAERLALLFAVDATGSMGPHIQAVKAQITAIVADMRRTNPTMKLHLGFIGYRDHKDCAGRPEARRFDVLSFTEDLAAFQVPAILL